MLKKKKKFNIFNLIIIANINFLFLKIFSFRKNKRTKMYNTYKYI